MSSVESASKWASAASTQVSSTDHRADVPANVIGRYTICTEIASGGMASVHYGRLQGPAGFTRAVAIKRLHPQYAKDPEFVAMFLDEARVAARVRHPNVVAVLDVVALSGELVLVMEYVHGESLAKILRVCQRLGTKAPVPVVVAMLIDVLRGLDAAHDVCDDQGAVLNLVHRDISPQNILVAADGLSRVLDFGIAKAVGRAQNTGQGTFKGKLGYMAPEQLGFPFPISRRTDVYAVGVVLWEVLTMQRFFPIDEPSAIAARLSPETRPERPSVVDPNVPPALDEIVSRATSHDPAERYETALQMADALEAAVRPATLVEVGRWIKSIVGDDLAARSERIALESAGWVSSAEGSLATMPDVPTIEVPQSRASGRGPFDSTEARPTSDSVPLSKPVAPMPTRGAWAVGLGLVVAMGIAAVMLGRMRTWVANDAAIQAIKGANANSSLTGPASPLVANTASTLPAASGSASAPDQRALGGAEGVHAGGVHAEGVHAEGVHAEGVHAEGVHSEGVHAEGVHSEGVHAAGVGVAVRGASPGDGFLMVIPVGGSAAPPVEVAPAPRRRSASKPAASSVVRIRCSPPYVIDDEGIRHMKPECID